jgi:hypothetical protein
VLDPNNELEEMHDEATNVNNNKGYNLVKIGAANHVDPGTSETNAYHHIAYGLNANARTAAHLATDAQAQGLTFGAFVPPGNLEEVIFFSFTSMGSDAPPLPAGMAPRGDVMELEAFQVDNQQEVFDLKPSDDLPPGIVTVQYGEADLQGTPEQELLLYTWTGAEWVEPACDGRTPLHLIEDNMFVVPVCETGVFGLFGDLYELYLPLTIR